MKTLLGFGLFPSLNSNIPNVVNPIGEISKLSQTYAKDIGVYTNTTSVGTAYLSFISEDTNGNAFILPDAYSAPILTLQSWILTRIKSSQFTNDRILALQAIVADFGNIWSDINIGEMVTDGRYWSPAWFTGKLKVPNDPNTVKIWFNNDDFKLSYPRFEIGVILPVLNTDIDIFQEDYDTFSAAVDAISRGTVTDWIQDVIDENPQTKLTTYSFRFYDKANTAKYKVVYITCVEWGPGASNIDAAYDAIKVAILENSKFGEEVWGIIAPDLFNPTEFAFVPEWLSYSIPGKTTAGALNSPVTDVVGTNGNRKELDHATAILSKWWTAGQIKASHQIVPVLHKSLRLSSVGKPTNINNLYKFTELYKDYALIPSTDDDFNNMAPDTQAFIIGMQTLLKAAETMTATSELPPGVSRSIRSGVVCAVTTVNAVKILVIAKPYYSTIVTS